VDELFTAVKGEGAYRNGQPSCVLNGKAGEASWTFILTPRLANTALLGGRPNAYRKRHAPHRFRGIRPCFVRADGARFLELGLHLYDMRRRVVIVREAGGFWKHGRARTGEFR
jgi:fructose-1,6-bisphosphatase/inositol monophosphatase family enzyme